MRIACFVLRALCCSWFVVCWLLLSVVLVFVVCRGFRCCVVCFVLFVVCRVLRVVCVLALCVCCCSFCDGMIAACFFAGRCVLFGVCRWLAAVVRCSSCVACCGLFALGCLLFGGYGVLLVA